jgi:hypothetical protein
MGGLVGVNELVVAVVIGLTVGQVSHTLTYLSCVQGGKRKNEETKLRLTREVVKQTIPGEPACAVSATRMMQTDYNEAVVFDASPLLTRTHRYRV